MPAPRWFGVQRPGGIIAVPPPLQAFLSGTAVLRHHRHLLPAQVITLYVSGALNTALSREHQAEIRRYLFNHQVGENTFHLIGALLLILPSSADPRLRMRPSSFLLPCDRLSPDMVMITLASLAVHDCRMKMEVGDCISRALAQCSAQR